MKNKILNNRLSQLKNDQSTFLNFLKSNFPLFHNSNFFYRDFQYGIRKYFEKKDIDISYPDSEVLANRLAKHLEEQEIFVKLDDKTWKVNFPEFATTVPGDPF